MLPLFHINSPKNMHFNYYGTWTLFRREIQRFLKVIGQTILAPILTAILYLFVFGKITAHTNKDLQAIYGMISYAEFLIPGLMMMTLQQNAFANTSSSLIQAKMMGNLSFMLMSPLTSFEMLIAYLGAAIVRGLCVGLGLAMVGWLFFDLGFANPLYVIALVIISGVALGSAGMIAGILSDKFEHLAAAQNFVIMPLSFLSGVFYSVHSLSNFWQNVSAFNPFFYLIDGMRYGFLGQSDTDPLLGLLFTGIFALGFFIGAWRLLESGYKLRN